MDKPLGVFGIVFAFDLSGSRKKRRRFWRHCGGPMVNETELTYLVFLIALTFIIHLILAHNKTRPRNNDKM